MLKLIISGNGESFKATYLKNFIASNGVDWKFNVAKAPCWVGLFEKTV